MTDFSATIEEFRQAVAEQDFPRAMLRLTELRALTTANRGDLNALREATEWALLSTKSSRTHLAANLLELRSRAPYLRAASADAAASWLLDA